ncbi:MAG: hypothetical protein GFH27_549327n80 [Chloroflexi bacterium AL-W]|nr:hypothetical protein [Chloroflexi bacterium AL-N1]NOK69692.1 hypothetical protein [Chloroflexi bacterium AL-N10]NOK72239.1 hypothetical protein [Chloroflexi bacterium AL-N5]NOK85068.1 hypothetical protein [Chloroflexi bacterium AL-W]NOK91821.1 hypothetical protein [Chloroflexi bacterium AL-N15]
MSVVLATTHHDPEGLLYHQIQRTLPTLTALFSAIAVRATQVSQEHTIVALIDAGAQVIQEASDPIERLGHSRRGALQLALQQDAPFLMFCDFDRVLHWAEFHPDELTQVITHIPLHDFTVLGRTERAFHSHPRIQSDTESIVNRVYASVSGRPWDVTAAARGMSRTAATAILDGCPDESIGTDVSWPLFVAQTSTLTLGYVETEGLEFETADRYPDEVAAVGGKEPWNAQLDADPHKWIQRLELARIEVEALLPYTQAR